MSKLLGRCFPVFAVCSSLTLAAAFAPFVGADQLNHQGRILDGAVNYHGEGFFKFALVDSGAATTYWSNDGTSTAGSEPTAAVQRTVTRGLYSVVLGDAAITNMTDIPLGVFLNADVRLRLWFGKTAMGPFELLAPDQRVASLPGIPGPKGDQGDQGDQGPATTDANTLYIGSDENADEADSTLQFGTDATPKVTLLQDGSVGIGTPTPEEKLEVDGGINIGNNSGTPKAGTIRWTGSDFEGYDGTRWLSLTVGNPPPPLAGMVAVGNAGNGADTTTYGAVAYAYQIGQYEVTNAEYAAFLNAVAATDPNALYSTNMGSDARGGINRSGSDPNFTYAVKANMGDKPVNYVSFWDACRFCNWLHNGMPSGIQNNGTTENGAYTLTAALISGNSVTRNGGAQFFIPSEDEWYKAAYHQPAAQGGDADGYWLYPTRSNSVPTVATADATGNIDNDTANIANYLSGADWNGQDGNVTTVGSGGSGSASFYGAYDMGGNVWEWNEAIISGSFRGLRGGSWDIDDLLLASFRLDNFPSNEYSFFGIRLASP